MFEGWVSAGTRSARRAVFQASVRLLIASCWSLCSGCAQAPSPVPRVEVGVFFGGQVQQLQRVEVDRARPPTIGFRVQLPQGRSAATHLSYEIVALGPAGRRVTRQEQLAIPPDQERVDQVVSIPPEARLGLWNIRVSDEHRVLADRAIFLVEADRRAQDR